MKPARVVRDAERALEREPQNLVLRLKLAAALRAAGRPFDAVDVYRSVAVAYQKEGRLLQALAVCRSILELAPEDLETHVLMGELEAARTGGASAEEPTQYDDGTRRPHAAPAARLPEVEVGPEEYDFDDEPTGTPPKG
jgi:hypothetical protein